jgi:hypothetical protein
VDRSRARERCVESVLDTDPSALTAGDHLDAEGRYALERFHGVVVTDDDMEHLARALWTRAPTLTLAWFHGSVWPEGLDGPRATALRTRLAELPEVLLDEHAPEYLLPLLAMVEVRDESGLRTLLHHWFDSQSAIRGEVLRWLARLGDTEHAAEMVAGWGEWDEQDRLLLGRVVCPAVRAFLEAEVAREEPQVEALLALLIQHGLPEPCARALHHLSYESLDDGELEALQSLLRSGDVAAAVERAAELVPAPLLGLLPGEWARSRLQHLRANPHLGQVVAATTGLALAGDEESRSAFRAFLDDDRFWMIGAIDESVWSRFNESWWVEHWLERLDTNCCLGHQAMVVLRSLYPTIPFEDGYGGAGTRRTREWIRSQRWKRSRLVDGLVPAAP